jgi:hypothetical protein
MEYFPFKRQSFESKGERQPANAAGRRNYARAPPGEAAHQKPLKQRHRMEIGWRMD